VHRIDRDTSGVVLFARSAAAHRALSMAFEGREVEKRYLAFTRGVPSPVEGIVDVPLHRARKGRMRPAAPGELESLPSSSRYRVLRSRPASGGPVACVEVRPHTGRQHQIRVHLRSLGAPLLVDPLYGRCDRLEADALGTDAPAVPRLTLHAHGLSLRQPGSGARLDLSAPLPDDLGALDVWLGASP
jgi:tRNA pseudouridine32 synthase/23S rRNA pseudouridine746 synthase